MPNLYATSLNRQEGGYLQSRLGVKSPQTLQINSTQAGLLDTTLTVPEDHWAVALGKYTMSAPVGVLDSLASLVPGIERGDIEENVYGAVGQPGFAAWLRAHREGADVASAILGSVAIGAGVEVAGSKIVGSAWMAASGLGRATQPLINLSANAQRAASQSMLLAAQSGTKLGFFQGISLSGVTTKFAGSRALAMGTTALTGAGRAAISEAAVMTLLQKNSAVWSEDMRTNLLFGVLGVGVGGAAGAISARSQLYKWANSPEMKMTTAQLRDPGGYEASLAEASRRGMDVRMTRSALADERLETKTSAVITNIALNARRQEETAAQSGVRNSTQTAWEGEVQRELQTMTSRGSFGVPNGNFSMKGTQEGRNLMNSIAADPTILFGANSISRVDPEIGIKGQLAARDSWIKKVQDPKTNATASELRLARALSKESPLVLVDGHWLTVEDAAPILDFKPISTRASKVQSGFDELVWESEDFGKFQLREDGVLNRDWNSLPVPALLEATDAMNQMMTNMLRGRKVMAPRQNPHFMEIDMAVEFEKRGGEVDWLRSSGITDTQAARIESLKQKSLIADNLKGLSAHDRIRLNLPQMSSAERVGDMTGAELKSVLRASRVDGVTIDSLQSMRLKTQEIFDLIDDVAKPTDLDGNLFNFNRANRERGGEWQTPVMGFFEDAPSASWSKSSLGDQIAERKAIQLNTARNTKNAPLTAGLADMMANSPVLHDIMDGVRTLSDDMLAETSGTVAATAGAQFLTLAHRIRNNPTLLAAQILRRVVNQQTEGQVNSVFKRLSPIVDRFSGQAGQQSRLLFNQYYTHSAGWDIVKTQTQVDGKIAFVLDSRSLNNEERLGRKVIQGEILMSPDGKTPIVLDQLGDALRTQLESEMKTLLHERNAVRATWGLEPINNRPFYVAPQSTKDKFVGFTLDQNNRVVPGGAVIESTQAGFDAAADKLRKTLPDGHRFMTQQEIAQKSDLWELASMDFVDPTRMAAPSGPQKGGLVTAAINPMSLEHALDYIKHGYEQTSTGLVRSIFDSQLKSARIHRAAAETQRARPFGTKGVFDIFEETLLGIPAHANPSGLTLITDKVDKMLDSALAKAHESPLLSGLRLGARSVVDMIGDKLPGKIYESKSYEKMVDELGPYMPFKKVEEYLEYSRNLTPPWKSKELARNVNRVGTGVILRWGELVHPAMNIAGVITSMPGVIGARNAPIIGRVKGIGVIDSVKIMARGGKRMFKQSSHADWDMMKRNGDATQDAAEIHKQLSLVKSKNSFQRLMTGDPKSSSKLAQLGIEGVASYMTDTSENFSRSWSHFIGLELADYHGITGMEARHTFARKIADDAIANYDPLNRPEIYNNAFGSMYGLFLSYSQNYYQRLFRWMEDGDYNAIGRTMALQSSMFGFTGLPGFRQVAALLGGEEDGDDLVTGIYKKFGPSVGSVVAQGGFNQITTIFGLPAVALHSRGDTNIRHPALDFAGSGMIPKPVGLEVLSDVIGGIWGAAANVTDNPRYAAEILARNMPSRALRGTLTVMATEGQEADAYGNLITETNGWAETAYRIMGLRSARQSASIEGYFLNQRAKEIQSQKMDELRSASRAMIRSGNMDGLSGAFDKYVEAGGRPQNYPVWIRGLVKEADNTRTENQLLQSLRNPTQQDLARRIELMTGAY